jgi:hypothetical protein
VTGYAIWFGSLLILGGSFAPRLLSAPQFVIGLACHRQPAWAD